MTGRVSLVSLFTVGGCLVSWDLKKQPGVSLLSTEANFVEVSVATIEIKSLVSLLTEISGELPPMPSILQEGNIGGFFMVKNTAISEISKYVDIWHQF